MGAAPDGNESVGLLEPMLVPESSRHRGALVDLALELGVQSAAFRGSLPDGVMRALADLVRAMNCYYSNLIEGHNTHPVDIERALKNDYSVDPEKRNLQLEATAHIAVQAWIDGGGLGGPAATSDAIREIHRRFYDLLPDELRWVENPDTGERLPVVPGKLRHTHVRVGRHVSISPGAVPRFLQRFQEAFSRLGRTDTILAIPAAHHRLAWIHPFLDGNGRVGRLMSHAMLCDALNTGGIWSIARGLARNEAAYKQHLANCDLPRRNDLDGRGHLSEEALAGFTRFFLEVCIDQVRFMRELVDPNRLRRRILRWAEDETREGTLPAKSGQILEAVLFRGELPRSDVPALVNLTDRQARRITSALTECGVLLSESPRSPFTLAFPATLAHQWMPGLFPEQNEGDR
ncbi:Fic family protein [Brucella intermedia]|uniref:Fic family protein n=1 Tax=Brucella intermedia TaxID=94625 RepID=UPI00209A6D37|nr:Fic family protein [Brucella intermedia]MCO7728734.1 Fic family protein [Brucella intermedia]